MTNYDVTHSTTVGGGELVAFIHSRNEFDYDECDHGTYNGGPSHGEKYAMCERQADALIDAGFIKTRIILTPGATLNNLLGGRQHD